MDPETEFDTDTMILDYFCSKATHALLLTRIAELSDRPAHADVDIVKIFDSTFSICFILNFTYRRRMYVLMLNSMAPPGNAQTRRNAPNLARPRGKTAPDIIHSPIPRQSKEIRMAR